MSGKEIFSAWLQEIPEEWTLEDVLDVLTIRAELQLAQADVDVESARWSMK